MEADFEEAPDLPPLADLLLPDRPELLLEDPLLEVDAPPLEEDFDAPPLDEEPDLEAPLDEVPLVAPLEAPRLPEPPEAAEPPLELPDDLVAPFDAPLELAFDAPLEAPFEVAFEAPLELPFEALLVAPPREEPPRAEPAELLLALPLDADLLLLLLPEDLEADFDALLLLPFDAFRLLPPLEAAFFGAAFFVAFAMIFNGF